MDRRWLLPLMLLLHSLASEAGSVVVSADLRIQSVDREQVRRIFLGREAMLGHHETVLIYRNPSNAIRRTFDETVLGRSGADLFSYWTKLIFTGRARPPLEASTDEEVKALISVHPGAVGYIEDKAVDASVRVLFRF